MMRSLANLTRRLRALNLRQVRKVIVAVVGSTVLVLGFAMVILPGPAIVVIPLGLAILATEFVWARRWLHRTRDLMGLGRKGEVDQAEAEPQPVSHEKAGG